MKKELKVVLHVLNLAVTSLAAEPACPVCSRYNYEEMLLQRVIRNELVLEHTLKDIKETNTKVVDALRKLQYENGKVNIAIEAMERKQILIEAALSTEQHRIKGELQIRTIQFRAKLASLTVNSGQNEQASSPPLMPVYTALQCTIALRSLQTSANYGADDPNQCSSMQAYDVMSMGDMVWVRTTLGHTGYFHHSDVTQKWVWHGVCEGVGMVWVMEDTKMEATNFELEA
ncbi:hypothetical protein DPMN_141376 [Dreissena polymorpha]|uniref:Uncharacterized protein n=1 Tax=Dreissena polymorpha TaxID=45954 RepID=A0A9D4G9K1_DREPO|nr:hypothetical protein DPMN_141376 [Dreissena polymorpha]